MNGPARTDHRLDDHRSAADDHHGRYLIWRYCQHQHSVSCCGCRLVGACQVCPVVFRDGAVSFSFVPFRFLPFVCVSLTCQAFAHAAAIWSCSLVQLATLLSFLLVSISDCRAHPDRFLDHQWRSHPTPRIAVEAKCVHSFGFSIGSWTGLALLTSLGCFWSALFVKLCQ